MHNVDGFPDVFGGSIPAMIWHDFMQKAVVGQPIENFATPDLSGYNTVPKQSLQFALTTGRGKNGGNGTPVPNPAPDPSPTCWKPHCHSH